MNRYLVFVGTQYYPRGGWGDYFADYLTEAVAHAEAEQAIADDPFGWGHVVDTETGRSIAVKKTDTQQ